MSEFVDSSQRSPRSASVPSAQRLTGGRWMPDRTFYRRHCTHLQVPSTQGAAGLWAYSLMTAIILKSPWARATSVIHAETRRRRVNGRTTLGGTCGETASGGESSRTGGEIRRGRREGLTGLFL